MRSSNAKTSLRDAERPPSRLGIASACGGRAGERRDAAAHVRCRTGVCPSSAAHRVRALVCSSKATDSSFRGHRRYGGRGRETLERGGGMSSWVV